jgi:hypothetical protein
MVSLYGRIRCAVQLSDLGGDRDPEEEADGREKLPDQRLDLAYPSIVARV